MCCYPRCRTECELEYLTKPLCWKHWEMLADCDAFSKKEDEIRKKIKLNPRKPEDEYSLPSRELGNILMRKCG